VSSYEKRLGTLETIYQRPSAGLTREHEEALKAACQRAAEEDGLDPAEVLHHAYQVLEEEGWPA